jgi:3-hydroxyisobutyrate dehydrogenase-like beta-hydroxyacid dehydrogenase
LRTNYQQAITVKGGRFLEAQLVGSRLPAENGELVVLAAGDKSLYNDCLSCFEVISKKSFYCGKLLTDWLITY